MVATVAPGTERLRVNQSVSENSAQTVVRGTITVPDPKPDVEQVLSTEKKVKVRNVRIVPDKVIVEGTLNMQIIYVAFKPKQSVHSMHGSIDFTTFVDLPDALPGMTVDTDIKVEDISFNPDPDCARDLKVAAVLEVFARVSDIMDIDVITVCPEGCDCETEEITVDELVSSGRRQVLIQEEFDVPREKPPAEKILDVDVKVDVIDTKVLRNKVIFDGKATITVMYVGMLPDQPVHSLHRTFKFSDFVDVPGAMSGMDVRFDIKVEDVDVEIVPNKCERLRGDIVLKLTANVVEPRTVDVITDVSGCTISPEFTLLKVASLVGEESTQVVIKDTFETPDPKPDVEKVLEIVAENITINDTKLIQDKAIVSGEVRVRVVYVAAEEKQSVHALHRDIPFRAFTEVMGAMEDNNLEIKANVEYLTANTKGCEITIEAVLMVTAKVTRPLSRDVLTSVDTTPEPTVPPTGTPCPPGETFEYIMKSGDTLYSVGRTYGVPLNQMIAANRQLPNVNNIPVGTVINVPCVAKG